MKIVLDSPLRVLEILAVLGLDAPVCGAQSRAVTAVAALDDPDASEALSFCTSTGAQAESEIAGSQANVILCKPEIARRVALSEAGKLLIGVDNPRLAFIRVLALSSRQISSKPAVAASASIDETAKLDSGVRIGAGAVVAGNCVIGSNAHIDHHAILYEGIAMGAGCVIQAGAVLGAEGFGFERDEAGCLHRFPQYGRVILGDDVEIGACTCVDRGALGDTVIGRGSKVDDGAYIGHNVRIGEHCLIMAQTVLCGSVVIGDRVEVSPGAIIRDKVRVGDDARIGLGAVVVRNVGPGEIVAGVPARPLAAGNQKSAF